MHWGIVEIEDLQGKKYRDTAAMDFVLDHVMGKVVVKPYAGDKFALFYNQKNYVSPDDVQRLLSDSLLGKCKKITIDGMSSPPVANYVPNVAIKNPINVAPKYVITLELGDIDALFDPVTSSAEPWKEKGVQQRLQALGYLYTPLNHPDNAGPANHSKSCWKYYKRIHKKEADDSAALAILQREVTGNLIASKFPKSGIVREKSKLPPEGKLRAIRFPGGYCISKAPSTGLFTGDHEFKNNVSSNLPADYVFEIGCSRYNIEKRVFDDNPLMGKFPLIAKVEAVWPDGKIEPAPNVPVLIKLAMPDPVPDTSEFAAPELPDKLMNYSLDGTYWKNEAYPDHMKEVTERLEPAEWRAVHRLTKAAFKKADEEGDPSKASGYAKPWIDTWTSTNIDYSGMEVWWDDDASKPAPLTVKATTLHNRVPKVILDQPSATPPKLLVPIPQAAWTSFQTLCQEAKTTNPADPNAARTAAEGWLNLWKDGGATNAWDGATPPASITEQIASAMRPHIAPALGQPPVSDPGGTGPRISQPTWDSFMQLARKASERNPGNIAAARDLAKRWATQWEQAAGVSWPKVRNWWGDENNQPYPVLDQAKIDNAKRIVDFLLADREKGAVSERSGVGQRKYMRELMESIERDAPATDPQKRNAPKVGWGGKSGGSIDEIFDIPKGEQDGFHKKRPSQTTDFGTLKLATLPDQGKHPHAAQCLTNDKGFAGVLFKPSQCGGDTYKLGAYIDPDWLATKSPGVIHESTATTGTMVVWRNIRLNRYWQFRKQLTGLDAISAEFRALLLAGNVKYDTTDSARFGRMHLLSPLTNLEVIPGAPAAPGTNPEGTYPPMGVSYLLQESNENLHLLKFRPFPVEFVPLETHFKRGYCEWIADCSAPKAIEDDDRKAAIRKGTAAFDAWPDKTAEMPALIWDKFMLEDASSPFFVNFRGVADYNSKLAPDEKRTALINNQSEHHGNMFFYALEYFWCAIAEHFAEGGAIPGLTIIQLPRADTWDPYCLQDGLKDSAITSGYATASRTVYVSFTDEKYKASFIYSATSNTLHELGHTLGIAHQFGGFGFVDESHQKTVREKFKTPADDDCVCVMSYTGCYGDLCGKCLLSLRGWKTH